MRIDSGIRTAKSGRAVCPLQRVRVAASLGDNLVEVQIQQFFKHTGKGNIEALYTFPLPHKGSVTSFSATIGETEIQGELCEKEEARRHYDEALQQGDSAFLLESHRPDIFQVSLGQILPGEDVVIKISYIEELSEVDGEIRWMLPTVIAPRYSPGRRLKREWQTTDRVPDADLITPPIGDAPYVLELEADITLTRGLRSISSPSHKITVAMTGAQAAKVTLATEGELLDRDLVLLCKPLHQQQSGFFTADDDSYGDFGYLTFVPELEEQAVEPIRRKEHLFLLDISGSMGGEKLEQAKKALRICLRNLMFGDTFNIVAFESRFTLFSPASLEYSEDAQNRADSWVTRLRATGGTEIYEPVAFVLQSMPRKAEYERVVFLFTDGQVGNESEVIDLVKAHKKGLSMFTFGIDTAVNKRFIDGLAEAGNGLPEYIYPGERIEDKVIRQFARIQEPYLSEVELTTSQGKAVTFTPQMPIRLYNSEAYSFVVHMDGMHGVEGLVITGNCAGVQYSQELTGSGLGTGRLFALQWAKERLRQIESLIEESNEAKEHSLRAEAVALSIQYGLLSTYTSYVAVHRRKVKETGLLKTVVVPVAAPYGWQMDSILQDHFVASDMMCFSFNAPQGKLARLSNRVDSSSSEYRLFDGIIAPPTPIPTLESTFLTDAAALQNADGSFGQGDERVKKTSLFVIGTLILGEDSKPYRIQLKKAGAYLTKQGDIASIGIAAIELLMKHKLLAGNELRASLDSMQAHLSPVERQLVQDLLNGDFALLLAQFHITPPAKASGHNIGQRLLELVVS